MHIAAPEAPLLTRCCWRCCVLLPQVSLDVIGVLVMWHKREKSLEEFWEEEEEELLKEHEHEEEEKRQQMQRTGSARGAPALPCTARNACWMACMRLSRAACESGASAHSRQGAALCLTAGSSSTLPTQPTLCSSSFTMRP